MAPRLVPVLSALVGGGAAVLPSWGVLVAGASGLDREKAGGLGQEDIAHEGLARLNFELWVEELLQRRLTNKDVV